MAESETLEVTLKKPMGLVLEENVGGFGGLRVKEVADGGSAQVRWYGVCWYRSMVVCMVWYLVCMSRLVTINSLCAVCRFFRRLRWFGTCCCGDRGCSKKGSRCC